MVAGFNAAGAWKLERGRPDATVAILDTGIVWSSRGLRDQIHLNTGELPYPEHADGSSCATYDCNGDGVVNVEDYASDPRVSLSYAGRSGPGGLRRNTSSPSGVAAWELPSRRRLRIRPPECFRWERSRPGDSKR